MTEQEIYDEVIVATTSDLEYHCKFDSEDWTDRVDMVAAFWTEMTDGGVFSTLDGHVVRFNPASVSAVLVAEKDVPATRTAHLTQTRKDN